LVLHIHINIEMFANPSFYALKYSGQDRQCETHSKPQANKCEQKDGVNSVLPQTIGCLMI